MYRIGVSGDTAGLWAELERITQSRGASYKVSGFDPLTRYDILLFHEKPADFHASSTNILLLNSDEPAIADVTERVKANLVISYGFNSKASITASSIDRGSCCVCVQRGFRTITGEPQERQEFTVTTGSPHLTLAAVSVGLAMNACNW